MVWTQFPLHPETPPEGQSYAELFAGREQQVARMKEHLRAIAAEEGLPYAERDRTFNSRLAQELAKWAETRPGGEAIHEVLFRAYFADGKNLAQHEVLLEAAATAGLDQQEARRVLEERSFSDAVDADWRRSVDLGLTGVPTFVAGGYGVVGAQPLENLEALLEKAEVPRR